MFATHIVDDPRVELVLIAQRFDLFYNGKGYSETTRNITFKDLDGRVVTDHTSYYNDQLSYTVKTIRKKGKDVVILKQVPIFGNFEACNWEPRIKKLFSQERVCTYDNEFIDTWQQPSIDFIDNFAASNQVEVFDPLPYFNDPLQNSINIYSDTDHLNADGSRFLAPYFVKAMDEILARKMAKTEANDKMISTRNK